MCHLNNSCTPEDHPVMDSIFKVPIRTYTGEATPKKWNKSTTIILGVALGLLVIAAVFLGLALGTDVFGKSTDLAGSGVSTNGQYYGKYNRSMAKPVSLSAYGSTDTIQGGLGDPSSIVLRDTAGPNVVPAAASPASPPSEPFITADAAILMMNQKGKRATIIVVSPQCGACHALRATVMRLLAAGALSAKSVNFLAANDFMTIKDKFPAVNSVPHLFKVGDGAVHAQRVGNAPDNELVSFVKNK